MKIPLLRGRDFTERDNEKAPKIAVVNQAFAKLYSDGRDPVGERIGLGELKKADIEIIGLAGNAQYYSLRDSPPPTVYQPIRQAQNIPYMYFELRTAGDPLALVPSVRGAVAAIDPSIPLFGVSTQSRLIDEALLQERMFAKLTSLFGTLALVLACVGLYGVLSYAFSRRIREIGIRIALGADRMRALRMVLRESLLLTSIGVAIGVPASLLTAHLASRLISDALFGLKPMDLSAIASAAVLMFLVGFVAGWIPARRASCVDPMVALRYE
jgi:predicted permease